jgi:hypothetical protein
MKHDTISAARFIGGDHFKPKTLENWRVLGIGPAFYKIGNKVYYDEADLSAWLATRKRTSTSDTGPQPNAAA